MPLFNDWCYFAAIAKEYVRHFARFGNICMILKTREKHP